MKMKINDFKTFDEFLVYIKQNNEEMKYWSEEKIKSFCDRVSELMEKSPEFKKRYDDWSKKLELKERARYVKIKIGGSNEDTLYAKAYLKLKQVHKENKSKPVKTIKKLSKDKSIEI
jgi:GGDEF domain-containing protein